MLNACWSVTNCRFFGKSSMIDVQQPSPMNSDTSPWKIRQPCRADWNQMRGDDRRRFCEHCQKYVYNVSAMPRAERESFASPAKMGECIFYCQRADGQIADLSFLAALRRWFPFLRLACWTTLVGLLPFITTGCPGMRRISPDSFKPLPQNEEAPDPQLSTGTNTVQLPRTNL
jgi:hypothetical protein